jgi:alcohol dehydrogenase
MNTTMQGLLAGQTEAIELEEILKPGITRATMKGLVYGGPGIIELKNIPIPEILKPTDAVVKILKTTICGTDLGISHGKTLLYCLVLLLVMKGLV